MAKQNPLQQLLNKPLSRKEFLQHIGVLLLAVFGISKLIDNLLQHDQKSIAKSNGSRWGNGKFGG